MGYPSDLSDLEWDLIKEHFPPQGKMGRPRRHSPRQILNAIYYMDRTGCQWRYLPKDFPPWKTVYTYFRKWCVDGKIKNLNRVLSRKMRRSMNRDEEPSAACLDSQSIKTTETARCDVGYDANKKIKGRKRHVLVDTLGLILALWVHSAGMADKSAASEFVERTPAPSERLQVVWADLGYLKGALRDSIKAKWGARLEIKKHPWQGDQRVWLLPGDPIPEPIPKPKGFVVLPKRWVVERTFGWLGRHRRHSKDYERLTSHSEAWILVSMTRIILTRMTQPPSSWRARAPGQTAAT